MLIDSHCHLDYFKEEERDQIISNAKQNGVDFLQTIGTRFSKSNEILTIVNDFKSFVFYLFVKKTVVFFSKLSVSFGNFSDTIVQDKCDFLEIFN